MWVEGVSFDLVSSGCKMEVVKFMDPKKWVMIIDFELDIDVLFGRYCYIDIWLYEVGRSGRVSN